MDHKTKIAIFIAILFHVSGLIGMMTASKPWFISMTPITLLLMFGLLWWTEDKTKNYYLNAAVIFITGLAVEIIGVNTALFFGEYTYGNVMGIKVAGVPLMMGIQWWVTIVCSAHLLSFVLHKTRLNVQPVLFALLAALITTAYDVLIEPTAIAFGYWHWAGDTVPLYNYVCWFLISFGLHYYYVKIYAITKINVYAVVLFIVQALFFLVLSFVILL